MKKRCNNPTNELSYSTLSLIDAVSDAQHGYGSCAACEVGQKLNCIQTFSLPNVQRKNYWRWHRSLPEGRNRGREEKEASRPKFEGGGAGYKRGTGERRGIGRAGGVREEGGARKFVGDRRYSNDNISPEHLYLKKNSSKIMHDIALIQKDKLCGHNTDTWQRKKLSTAVNRSNQSQSKLVLDKQATQVELNYMTQGQVSSDSLCNVGCTRQTHFPHRQKVKNMTNERQREFPAKRSDDCCDLSSQLHRCSVGDVARLIIGRRAEHREASFRVRKQLVCIKTCKQACTVCFLAWQAQPNKRINYKIIIILYYLVMLLGT